LSRNVLTSPFDMCLLGSNAKVPRKPGPGTGLTPRSLLTSLISATDITNFLEYDGTLKAAQRIAGHADSPTNYNSTTAATQRCFSKNMVRIRY
jgi:hypothetical protein